MIDGETFRDRRRELASAIGAGLLIIPGNGRSARNFAANAYPMHQDGTFLYYFGLEQPFLVGIIDAGTGTCALYGDEPTEDQRMWEGPLPTLADLAAAVGIATHGTVAQLKDTIEVAKKRAQPVHFTKPYRAEILLLLSGMLDVPLDAVNDHVSSELVAAVIAQREVKTDEELAEIEDALATTSRMQHTALAATRPGKYEREVVAAVTCLAETDDKRLAYPPIFTRRGDILHNLSYDGRLVEGDLVLHDCGAMSPRGYASDITRTFPASGRFSPVQQEFYDLVLRAQEAAIEVLAPGVKFVDAHLCAASVLAEGLIGLGLLAGAVSDAVESGAYSVFMPHGLGHQLGLDVHDMEALGEDAVGYDSSVSRSERPGLAALRLAKPLRAGMTVTVEPGFYVIEALLNRCESQGRYAGQVRYEQARKLIGLGGIRVEDDVVVTSGGARVLGPPIPKSISAIEGAMAH